MSVNPFEPPRAADVMVPGTNLDPAGTLPEAALGELVASAPWVRWSARLALVSAVVGLLNSGVSLARAGQTSEKVTAVVGILLGVPLAILFVVLFRRCAEHTERLLQRRQDAVAGVMDSHRALFKTFGVLMILSLTLVPLAILGGILTYAITKGTR